MPLLLLLRRLLAVIVFVPIASIAAAQSTAGIAEGTMPPDYPGVWTHLPGIYVTPVPNSPFTAQVDILGHDAMPDGTERVRSTMIHVARSSSGRIYNESRLLVGPGFKGTPALTSAHTYDPSSRLSVVWNPHVRIAREVILDHPALTDAHRSIPPSVAGTQQQDLGVQSLEGLTLQGIRKTRVVPAQLSGTGKPVTITDEYWYSPDLSIYMIIKHNDPRSGEQLVAVSHIERTEPAASVFAVPADFKVVDETPL